MQIWGEEGEGGAQRIEKVRQEDNFVHSRVNTYFLTHLTFLALAVIVVLRN